MLHICLVQLIAGNPQKSCGASVKPSFRVLSGTCWLAEAGMRTFSFVKVPGRKIRLICEETFSFPFGFGETRDIPEVVMLFPVGKGVTVAPEPRGEVFENWQQIRNAGGKNSDSQLKQAVVLLVIPGFVFLLCFV